MSVTGRKNRKKKKALSDKELVLTVSLKNSSNSSVEQLPLCLAVEWDSRTKTLSASAILLKSDLMV